MSSTERKRDMFKTLETCMRDDQELKLFHVSILLINKLRPICILWYYYICCVMLQRENNLKYYSRSV